MKSTIIAVHLAKSVFEVVDSHQPSRVAGRHRLSRAKFLRFVAQRPAATVLHEIGHHMSMEEDELEEIEGGSKR